jgi:F-type H+-transporting ATPase subunit b
MDAILTALGGLLLRALPTFFLVLLLHFYLKRMFFAPLDKVLEARRQATEGARSAAQTSLELASRKTSEYETAIREARGGIYKEQEETRREWRQAQAGAIDDYRRGASDEVKQARVELATESASATQSLAAETDRLASAIAESILRGRRS